MTATTTRPISPAQIKFVNSLLSQREVPADTLESLEGFETTLTTRSASSAIDLLKSFPYAPKTTTPDSVQSETADEVGIYENDHGVFQVKLSRAGRLYTMTLDGGSWTYATGAIHKISKTDRISVKRAIELSANLGQCVRCGRVLSNEKSIKRAIGPVCLKKI